MRLYTLQEAKKVLPYVIPVVEQLRAAYVELRSIQAATAAMARNVTADGHAIETSWASQEGADPVTPWMEKMEEAATRLEAWGIEVKDPERGLIDFYHERNGQVVYLCWQLGEPDIEWWHETDAGFAGRQPL